MGWGHNHGQSAVDFRHPSSKAACSISRSTETSEQTDPGRQSNHYVRHASRKLGSVGELETRQAGENAKTITPSIACRRPRGITDSALIIYLERTTQRHIATRTKFRTVPKGNIWGRFRECTGTCIGFPGHLDTTLNLNDLLQN